MARPRTYRLKPAKLRRIEDKGRDRAEQIADAILRLVRLYAPYDSDRRPDRRGPRHLKFSYYAEMSPDGNWQIKATKRYWRYVEYGTEKHGRAQPHVRPAIEEVRKKYGL